MPITRDLTEKILSSVNIVNVISHYIPVNRKGREYLAVCPFHDDKNPSLHISEEKQIFKCFVDGTGGNAFDFVMAYEKVNFIEAVKKVASIGGIDDPALHESYVRKGDPKKTPLFNLLDDLNKYYIYSIRTSEGKVALDYLLNRGLTDDDIKHFDIGYAPSDGAKTIAYLRAKGHKDRDMEQLGVARVGANMKDLNAGRLIFPIHDEVGRVVGFSARKITDEEGPKYINSTETPLFHKSEILYNYHRVKEEARRAGHIYVLEGFMDVISTSKAGEPAVALMGTALTKEQILLLKKTNAEIRLCLDGDAPGQTAMNKAIKPLSSSGLSFRLVLASSDEDPDELYQRVGKEGLLEALNNLVDPFAFQLDFYTKNRKLATKEDKEKAIRHFLPYLRSLESGIAKEDAIEKLALATGYNANAIRNELKKATPTLEGEEFSHESQIVSVKETRLEKAERQILYYMLRYNQGLEFYKENIDSLSTPIYQQLANYMLDYTYDHEGESISLPILLNNISEDEEANKLKSALINLASREDYPPCDLASLTAVKAAIEQEKEKAYSLNQVEAALALPTSEEKAAALNELLQAKKAKMQKKKEKTNG